MSGERGGIGDPHFEDFTGEEENEDRNQTADDERDGKWRGEFDETRAGDGFSAFETDGEKEINGESLVDLLGEF